VGAFTSWGTQKNSTEENRMVQKRGGSSKKGGTWAGYTSCPLREYKEIRRRGRLAEKPEYARGKSQGEKQK